MIASASMGLCPSQWLGFAVGRSGAVSVPLLLACLVGELGSAVALLASFRPRCSLAPRARWRTAAGRDLFETFARVTAERFAGQY